MPASPASNNLNTLFLCPWAFSGGKGPSLRLLTEQPDVWGVNAVPYCGRPDWWKFCPLPSPATFPGTGRVSPEGTPWMVILHKHTHADALHICLSPPTFHPQTSDVYPNSVLSCVSGPCTSAVTENALPFRPELRKRKDRDWWGGSYRPCAASSPRTVGAQSTFVD